MANPPTLILVIESLLNVIGKNKIHNGIITGSSGKDNYCVKKDASTNNNFDIPLDYSNIDENDIENCHNDLYNENDILIFQFLNEIYPALNEWISWFLNSQKGPSSTIDVEDTEGGDCTLSLFKKFYDQFFMHLLIILSFFFINLI